jgi:hypothetical protein
MELRYRHEYFEFSRVALSAPNRAFAMSRPQTDNNILSGAEVSNCFMPKQVKTDAKEVFTRAPEPYIIHCSIIDDNAMQYTFLGFGVWGFGGKVLSNQLKRVMIYSNHPRYGGQNGYCWKVRRETISTTM